MEKLNSCAPITIGCDVIIRHIAFDGCAYFCTIRCHREIVQLDDCLKPQCRYPTCREYDCLCYDWGEGCFWASAADCPNRIFKLSRCLEELDCIPICLPGAGGVVSGISYCCCKNTLLVAFPQTVAEVDKCGGDAGLLYETHKDLILSILCLCPGFLIAVQGEGRCFIEVVDGCGRRLRCHPLAGDCVPEDLVFRPCACGCSFPKLGILCLKWCRYARLCDWDVDFGDLGFLPCRCHEQICCSPCPPPCCKGDPCCDVLESIALMEAALSHILNAEGEKLQKVLAETDDIDKILCVNREINKTVINATHLEHVLYAKLSELQEHC